MMQSLGKPNAHYLSEVAARRSDAACGYLEQAIGGTVPLKDFPDFEVDLAAFDWRTGSDNRHWWWQLHQFPVIRWYVQSNSQWRDSEQHSSVIRFLFGVLENWARHAGHPISDSPLSWHDHATALRLRNLVEFTLALHAADVVPVAEDQLEFFETLLCDHVKWLSLERNYTRHTNHGFEQAETLFRCAIAFPQSEIMSNAKGLAIERLRDEVEVAFTEQGVHRENSPGYQRFMVSRLKQLSELSTMDDANPFSDVQRITVRATQVLAAMRLPNGLLPMIGDTRGHERVEQEPIAEGTEYSVKSGTLRIYDYSASGYLISEYVDAQSGQTAKLILKCGHLSDYHRHDDDLLVYWQVGQACLVGDGGLYSHNERDPVRKFLRSWHAHSCIGVLGVNATRKRSELFEQPVLHIKRNPLRFVGVTFMYSGIRLRRVVNLEELIAGVLVVEDRAVLQGDADLRAYTNWIFPDAGAIGTLDRPGSLSVRYHDAGSLNVSLRDIGVGESEFDHLCIVRGEANDPRISGLISRSFNRCEPCWRAISSWSHRQRRRTTLTWESALDKAGEGQ